MGTQISKSEQRRSSVKVRRKFDLTNFAAITVVFNPLRSKKRYDLYRKFAQHIARSGVTLITVECIFDNEEQFALPKQKFQVTQKKNQQHLQIKAPSIFWLKENLINIAVRSLSRDIEYIAWLDADIELETLDWPHLTIDRLQNSSIVQLFQESLFLGPNGKKEILRRDYSFVYAMQHGMAVDCQRSNDIFVHPGYGWAMRRQTFDEIGGLLDFSVVGVEEIHFAFALYGRIDETLSNELHPDYRYLTRLWADRVARVASYGYRVTFLPIRLYHFWHGDRARRGYNERWSLLEEFQYSPLIDLEKNDITGLLRLKKSSDFPSTEMEKRLNLFQQRLIRSFELREEDERTKSSPTITTSTSKGSKAILSSRDVFRPTDDLLFHHHTSSIENLHINDSEFRSVPKSSLKDEAIY